jgi:hypothetical protein
MPFTVDQLDFLGVHVGVAIPPDFVENRRNEEKFARRVGEVGGRDGEMKSRFDGAKLEDLFKQAKTAAEGNDFKGALDLLDQVEIGLSAPDLPPPPVNPPPEVPPPIVPQPVPDPVPVQGQVQPPPQVQPPTVVQPPPQPVAGDAKTIQKLLAQSVKLNETVRKQFLAIKDSQGKFVDFKDKQRDAQNPTDAGKHKAEARKHLDDVEAAIVVQTNAVAALDELKKKLAAITIPQGPDAPALTQQLQAAALEVDNRLQKATGVEQTCLALHGKMKNAYDTDVDFMIGKDGIKAYDTNAQEIPAILLDLLDRLPATRRKFEDAYERVEPHGNRMTQMIDIVSAGKPLSQADLTDLASIEGEVPGISDSLGKLNAPIIKDWKEVNGNIKSLNIGAQPEIKGLVSRGNEEYDEFMHSFGMAQEMCLDVQQMVVEVKKSNDPSPGTPKLLNEAMDALIKEIVELDVKVAEITNYLGADRKAVTDKRAEIAALKPNQLDKFEEATISLNQALEKTRADARALNRADRALESRQKLYKARYSKQKPDKKKASDFEKKSEALGKKMANPLKEAVKIEKEMEALQEVLRKKYDAAKAAAPAPDGQRLDTSIKALPQLPDAKTLLPSKGVSGWKKGIGKGGSKAGAKLFDALTKAWEEAEKKSTGGNLDKMEKAAALCLAAINEVPNDEQDDVDRSRMDKCREALGIVRKLRLKSEMESLPAPPYDGKTAEKARSIEARALLENGTPTKPPGEKGESDSFFLKNSEGKVAFIFKPKQGENVKEGGKEGEGVVREVLSSKFNDQMKEMTGLDFGVCPTNLTRLESDSFKGGEKSKDTSRMGALQQAAPNEGSLLSKMTEDPQFLKSVKTEDVQKIALMDFMTLQGDRNVTNLLVQDVNGEKRLVPIDGGFAFPDKELFNASSIGMSSSGKYDPNQPPPKDDQERQRFEENAKGKNAIMSLPQSEEKFSPEMLKHIESLDPDKMVKGMKAANKDLEDSAPELKGMVGDENLENMRRSIVFLKQAAKEFSVLEISQIYALDFKRLLEVPTKQLQKEIEAVIKTARARNALEKVNKSDEAEYTQLGGDTEIKKLGWNPATDRVLRLNWKRKIDILKKKEPAPPPTPTPTKSTPPSDEDSLNREFKSLGGDKELDKIAARPDDTLKMPKNVKLSGKVARLRNWQKFKDFGGDAAYKKLVAKYRENQYKPFDQLSKDEQAAVAAFSGDDPDALGWGSKVDAFKYYADYK